MPHLRKRFAIVPLMKRLKFSRVVSIQGARQTGKSTLARNLLGNEIPTTEYVTFDKTLEKKMAEDQPDSFLESHPEAFPLVIDEAQKVPSIFDAVKLRVDVDNRPGQYVLLGSTEFSREVQIKESLTGRLSRVLIYPLTVAESLGLTFEYRSDFKKDQVKGKNRVTRAEFLKYLKNGGFPGMFSVRSELERKSLMDDWMALVTGRDLMQFRNFRTDPALAQGILELLPTIETPDLNSLCRKLRYNGRKVKTHLDLLEQLFAINSINKHVLGSGKKLYFLCDVGLAHHFGADLKRRIETWLHVEVRAQKSYSMSLKSHFSYYRSSRGGRIDLVIESENSVIGIKIIDTEQIDKRDFEILKAFKKKIISDDAKKSVRIIALGPYLKPDKLGDIELLPWEVLA